MTCSDRHSCSASLNIFREKQEVYDVTGAFPAKSCLCSKPFESSHGGSFINTYALIHDEVFVKTFFFVFNVMASKLSKDLQMSLGNHMN